MDTRSPTSAAEDGDPADVDFRSPTSVAEDGDPANVDTLSPTPALLVAKLGFANASSYCLTNRVGSLSPTKFRRTVVSHGLRLWSYIYIYIHMI